MESIIGTLADYGAPWIVIGVLLWKDWWRERTGLEIMRKDIEVKVELVKSINALAVMVEGGKR